ncbi:uncharacterized protein DS421_19g643020 [Arachis hypogaea]|uniref:Aminotransferase-like plant mobile domain-containing protein n=1 Tax=Arachis hypogaea TaxID=3818 RepID=A0A6B9V7G7_ARAHY|nr:uncharacterized protein DS421_19g643020 [Arachis hypogaea]
MEDERRLYRLDGVAHVAGTIDEENMPLHDRIIPYLERAGLYHLARLNAHWFWLDEPLVSAFIERWRPETNTFHMPFGECTITLQDVAYQLGLPVDGQAVSRCYQRTSEETVRIYARAYIMMLLSTQLFMDKSASRVHLRWLLLWRDLTTWAAIAGAPLHWRGCTDACAGWRTETSPTWLDAYSCYSHGSFGGTADYTVSSGIGSTDSSRYCVGALWFAGRTGSRQGLPTARGVQHLPEPALNIEYLHRKDGRGGDRWFPTYYRTWHQHWDERVRSVLSVQRVPDPGPSAEYLDWWHRVAHRILSPGIAFADPRPTQVPDDAILRGSSQAPARVPASDMPDNRRVERRRRIGTRAIDREWRWLDDMMQEEQVGGDDGGQADHRLRRSSARRRAARGG